MIFTILESELTFENIMTIVGSYAFPIAVTVWLLYERFALMQKFNSTLDKVLTMLEWINDRLD